MYSSPEHVSMDYDEQASPRARGAPSLYLQPNTKTCVFYKDGDPTFPGVKLAVNPRYYQNIDTLHDQLTEKIKELHNGVRSIHTPGGRHMVTSIHDLENQGKYVCSSKRQAKGLNLTHVGLRPWHAGKPPSGRRRYNIWPDPLQRHARKAWMGSKDHDPYPFRNAPKKITVIKNAEPMERHVLLLNRRTLQTFEQILSDLSEMFHMPVRRIYTAGGRPVFSLSAIFNGPEMYVVTSGDRFQPVSSSMSDPGTAHPPHPLVKRKAYTGDGVHQKLKDRREKLSRTRGKWKVWVTTNELPSAGTEAQVSITVYGHKGNSGPIPLGYAKGETFQPGNIDEFEISVGNIGEIYKIRVAHDNSGDYASWFCDEVRMRDVHTQEQLVFDCRRWLSRDEEDAEICRELPAARNDEQVLPIVNYDVTLTTGDLWNAGTSANVYITIYGERGDTGVRQLYLSTKQDKFGKGQTDTFTVEAVSLGNLKRVIIGHDGTVPGDGWYLEKVVVKESAKSQFEWVFPCHRWLDEGEEDGKIVRELKPLTEYNLDKVEKQRWKTEEWKFQNDNCVMLYSKLTQRPIRINPDSSVDVCAEYVDDQAIMRVIAKRDMVRVLQSCALPNCHLGIDNARVIGQGRGGPHCELMVRVQEDRSVMFASTKYKNQHMNFLSSGKPGDPRGSAGDPSMEFHVYCKGVFRDKGVVMLCTSVSQTLNIDHDNMVYATGRRNKLAHFRVHKVSEGNIRMFESVVFPNQFIRIKDGQVDCNGSGDRMCHFKVERVKEKGYVSLESLASRGIYVGMVPDGRVRPTVNTGDKNVRFFPEVIEFGIPKGSDLKPSPPPVQTKPRKARARKHSPSPTPRRSSPVPLKRRTPTPPPPKSPTPEPQRVESARSTFEDGDWKLWITSLENADNANIAMVVYGDRSNSGPISLGSSKDSQLFRAQNQDQFKANLAQVGKIYKIRLELTPVHTNRDPVWKVKEVKMQDMTTKETLKFKFNRWLSRDHDDREIMRELPAVRPRQNVLSVFHYQVHVYTGSEVGADTDANVYLVLFGERGDTGKRLLLQSDNDNMFQEGQLDIFELEAVDLGKLKRAVVSHDGEGSGEGWYCVQILVRESVDSTHEYVFPCDKWLDSGIDDGKTERVLKVKEPAPCPIKFLEHRPIPQQDERSPTPPPEEAKPEPGEWNVWLTTGQDHNNGTVNDVTLYVYGDDGCSDPLTLASGKDFQYFQPGHTDTFKVNLGTDLGELYKIRVGHSDIDRKSGWFLEKVKMQNLTTNETLTFKVKRWMWRQEDDSDVWRELPVVLPGQQPLPVITYTVEVYTGSQPGSETEANVYIQLMGSRGDTGKRLLYKSATNWSKFQEGQLDIFQVEAVSLDEVESVIIGHDGHGRGAGWYLEKVIVKEGDQPGARMFYFPCDRWLDEGQDDGLIERELQAAEPPKQSMGEYAVWVKTHRDSKPSQDSAVIFTAYGDKGKSRDIELTADKPVFQPGNTDQFQVSLGDIGELYKIRLARTRDDQGWHLQQVKLQDKDTKEETLFVFDRWMDRDQDDHDIVRERPLVKNKKEVLPMRTYEVTVHTGDHWAAETDANVYLTLYGSKGDSGKRCLYHSLTQTNKFQRNKVDSFLLEAVSLEDLQRVVIGHDGVGHGAGWFLDKVVVREMQGQNTNKMYMFHCGRWLDDHEDDGKKERELSMIDVLDEGDKPIEPKKGSKTQGQWQVEVTTSDVHNAGTHAQVTLTVYGSKGSSDPKPLTYQDDQDQFERNQLANFTVNVGDIGDIYKVRIEHDNTGDFPSWHLDKIVMTDKHTKQQVKFYADRWLSQDDDDGATARELVPVTTGKTGRPVLRYYVAVYTGDMNEADTTANVSLTVFGQYGDSGQHVLSDSKTHNFKFLHGQVDVFSLESVHLGRLDHIVLEHDGKNKDTAWFVEKVVIKESEHALTEHIFPSHCWMEAGSKRKPARLQVGCLRQQPASSLPHAEQVALQKDTSSKGQWLLTTTTAQHDEAPTDTDVFMVVYGTKCQTDPLRLQDYLQEEPQTATTQNTKPSREKKKKPKPVKQEKKKPFASGQVDVFKLDVGNVGDIYKIRITVDMKGKMPAWNIDKLKMKDIDTQQEFHFVHSGVLGGSADSEDYTLELPAIRPDLPPLQDVTYMVSVTTGNVPLAETEATVLCTVVGEWGDTGPRPFTAAKNNDTKFQRDQTDVFELRALDLGQLKKIVMSHSAHGRGRGWFCERVTVMEGEDADIETIFPCHRWLDTGCDDRRLERVLLPLAAVKTAAQPAKKLKSEGRYKCLLGTAGEGSNSKNNNSNNNNNNNSNNNNNTDLNTNNNSNGRKSSQRSGQKSVSVTVYGSKGVKNGVVLDNGDPDMFTAGSQDEFELNVGDIGNIHKIRVNNKVENDADAVWDVSEVTLLDQDTKEKLDFDFSPWVGQRGVTSCELPAVRPGQEVPPVIEYRLAVTTGGEEEEDFLVEEADVYVRLHGSHGDSGRRHLLKNKENKPLFQPGQTETFCLDAVDLGDIERVTITKGAGDDWHLLKIAVKAGEFAATETIFSYGRLIEDEDEVVVQAGKTLISQVAVPVTMVPHLPRTRGIWKVWTKTGDKPKMKVSSGVMVTLCGDKQESSAVALVAQDSDNPFMPGETDEFLVRVKEDIGDLVKVRLAFADRSKRSNWYLEHISFQDQDTHDEFTADVSDWIVVDEEKDGVKEIAAVWPGTHNLPNHIYQISTVTGEQKNAGTAATVYIEIQGQTGSTGKRQLKKSQQHQVPFQEGQTDCFLLESADLMDIQKVWIGHDGKKKGAGWFLQTVTVSKEESAPEYTFQCGRWLEKTEDDGAIERWLELSDRPPPPPSPPPPPGDEWRVWTTTGRDKKATSTGEIVMVIYGRNGKTAETPVGQEQSNKFQRGKTEEFEVRCKPNLGEIYKVRLGFTEDSPQDSSWQLDRLKLQHQESGAVYEFDVRSWLTQSATKDSWLEIPVRNNKPELMLPVIQYEVQVYTGDMEDGGTDAKVHLTIFGEQGDTGCRRLLKSLNNADSNFNEGQMDAFEVEAVDLQQLKHIVIGHNGTGAGNGWFLDKVVIQDNSPEKKKYVFQCNRWLDEAQDDCKIERKLKVKQGVLWQIVTQTSEEEASGCVGPATVVLYGQHGCSLPFTIGTDQDFSFGDTDTARDQFEVQVEYPEDVEDLGDLYKVRIGFEREEIDDEKLWNLEQIRLRHVVRKQEYVFELHDWIELLENNDSWRELPVNTRHKQDLLPIHKYWVQVWTSERGGAGTDAEVYLQISGERGDTGVRKLLKCHEPGTCFQAGKLDRFEVEAVDMQDLTQVVVGHNGKGVGAGWHLDKVLISESAEADKQYLFECDRWLDEGEDDTLTERILPLTKVIQKETDEEWKVWTTTGKHKEAGTQAQVVLAIYGERGCSHEIPLGENTNRKKLFGKSKTDDFLVKVKADIGEIYKIRIGFSEEELRKRPAWQVDKVKLQRLKTGEVYEFEVRDWIQTTTDRDGWREIQPTSEKPQDLSQVHKYQVEVFTGEQTGAGTDANVHLTICGERGDTGKRHLWTALNHKDRKFEAGNRDVFEVEAVDLKQLKTVTVGHDGKGFGSGWFLEKIIIREQPDDQKKYVFRCDRWLDEDEDDGLTERQLKVKEGVPWKIVTYSKQEGEEDDSPEGPATLVLYGEDGHSEPVQFATDVDFTFATDGPQDQFQVKVEYVNDIEDIGQLYKVRVGFQRDDEDTDVFWNLEKLKLENLDTGEEFEFELNDWIKLTEVSDSWRELPVKGDKQPQQQDEDEDVEADGKDKDDRKEDLQVHKYWVEVYTADKTGAGTDAQVCLQIFGERGDTGQRKLLRSLQPGARFEAGKMDVFEIEAVDMKDLQRVVVGHDGKGLGAGWYLDKIIIGHCENADRKFLFNCDRWLDEGEDDGLLERELKLTEILEDEEIKEGDWRVYVITSGDDNSGTLGQVTLTIFGEDGDTGALPLGEPASGLFETSDADQFDIWVEPEDVGKLTKIRIEHDAREPGKGWKLERIVMENRFDPEETLEFDVDRWLDVGEDDGDVMREMAAEWPDEDPLPVTKYKVQTFTGKASGGGTDAPVYITLCGENGDSGKRYLAKNQEGRKKFDKGKTDSFLLEAIDLGELNKVTIGHDGEGVKTGWYLDQVIITDEDKDEKYVFPCSNWLSEKQGDGKKERELTGQK